MRNTLIFVLAALTFNRFLPLVWQRDEFVKISWLGIAEWLITPSTYIDVLFILAVSLIFNYRTILILSIRANFWSGSVLGATTATLFLPYDLLNQWRVTTFGYEVGFMLALGLFAAAFFLPVFLRKLKELKGSGSNCF